MDNDSRQPIRLSGLEGLEPEGRRLEIAVWVAVGLGIGLRLLRYLLQFPLWVDEAKLATSLIDRGYVDLLDPLVYGQTSPVGYMWLSLTAVKLLGYNELALRLISFLAAAGGVLLVRRVASRLVTGLPLLLAVTLVSVSYYPIRFAGEVKPYSMDLFVAAALTAMAVEWWLQPKRSFWLWALVLCAPIALTLSNPAIFIAAGIGVTLVLPVWRSGNRGSLLALGLFAVVSLATFWLHYDSVLRDQYALSIELARTTTFWGEAFPPMTDPIGLIRWFLFAHSGRMFGYPIGFDHGGGALTFVFLLIGAVVFFRMRRRTPLALLLMPFGMALTAAAFQQYPYGLSGRISQWAVPAICILASTGLVRATRSLSSPTNRKRAIRWVFGFLVFFGLAQGVADIVHPYKASRDRSARDFARWFWVEKARDAELVCAWSDLRLPFAEPRGRHVLGNGQYWANQKIYSPRLARDDAADLSRVTDEHPLRVVFLSSMLNKPESGFAEWLEQMRSEYQQVGVERHKPAHYTDSPDLEQEEVVVFEFRPRVDKSLVKKVG